MYSAFLRPEMPGTGLSDFRHGNILVFWKASSTPNLRSLFVFYLLLDLTDLSQIPAQNQVGAVVAGLTSGPSSGVLLCRLLVLHHRKIRMLTCFSHSSACSNGETFIKIDNLRGLGPSAMSETPFEY